MGDSAAKLLEKIQRGEDSYLELKEVVIAGGKVKGPGRRALADELAAFANTRGGDLILGVRDADGEIVGIASEYLPIVERFIAEIAEQSVDPPLDLITHHVSLPDTTGVQRLVIHVSVPRSSFVHRSPSGYLKRLGDSKREMRAAELTRLFLQRNRSVLGGSDEQALDTAVFGDLEPALIERFRTDRTADDSMSFARKLGLVRPTEVGDMRATIAGILFCASEPERWLPQAYIQAVAYRGTEITEGADMVNYQLDARDITGPLEIQIAEAIRFVAKSQRVSASKTLGRSDRAQYDLAAVFEAVVNAVAHRDYSIYGSKIRLRMFSNRLELYSPGGLPNTLEIDQLPYRQFSRNSVITSRLAELPVPSDIGGFETTRRTMMDRRGEGVGMILRRSEDHSGRRPEYRIVGESEVILTIFAAE